MNTDDFDYNLPKELIAQVPKENRDQSRLLVCHRQSRPADANAGHTNEKSRDIEHRHFFDIIDYLEKGDVLVMNNSKVFPARLLGRRKGTGGKVEVFLHKKLASDKWECLVGGRRVKPGLEVVFGGKLACEIVKDNEDGTWELIFNLNDDEMMKVVEEVGIVPLPPYIKREERRETTQGEIQRKRGWPEPDDRDRYQTVYADEEKKGSVAAPTAGLHFTPELLEKIKAKGVQIEYITLHVGLGTFAPVKVRDATKHKMHAEWVEVCNKTIENILKAKKDKRRVVAVGTTSVRSLEAIFGKIENRKSKIENFKGWVDIFIYPGYEFKIVDAMITNFHLPKSTLMMLVSAFAGKDNIDRAYKAAVKEKYRFFSYGDAMFIK